MESQALTHKTEMVNKMKDYKKLEQVRIVPEDFLKEARLLPESCTNTEVSESYQDRLVEHENITKGE